MKSSARGALTTRQVGRYQDSTAADWSRVIRHSRPPPAPMGFDSAAPLLLPRSPRNAIATESVLRLAIDVPGAGVGLTFWRRGPRGTDCCGSRPAHRDRRTHHYPRLRIGLATMSLQYPRKSAPRCNCPPGGTLRLYSQCPIGDLSMGSRLVLCSESGSSAVYLIVWESY